MEKLILLEDLKEQVAVCMLDVLKLSPQTVFGQNYAYMKAFMDYWLQQNERYYNPVLANAFRNDNEIRYQRGEITKIHFLGKRKYLEDALTLLPVMLSTGLLLMH